MECNQAEQGFTACGVDQLMVVCSFDQISGSGCLHDTGPCQHGLTRYGYVGECQGRSQYTAHLSPETATRPVQNYHAVRDALSICVEALCNTTYEWYNDRCRREELFHSTVRKIREAAGDIRLTTMTITCAWCGADRGEKEGNGSTGETSTICPDCLQKQLGKELPQEVRRIAAAVGLAIGEVKESREARNQLEEIYNGLEKEDAVESFKSKICEGLKRPERGNPAEVAASEGSYVDAALEGVVRTT